MTYNLFNKDKSNEELCREFKIRFEQYKFDAEEMEGCEVTSVSTSISDLEKFFSYDSSLLHSIWIPRNIREELKRIGIILNKKRRSSKVIVTFKEVEKID